MITCAIVNILCMLYCLRKCLFCATQWRQKRRERLWCEHVFVQYMHENALLPVHRCAQAYILYIHDGMSCLCDGWWLRLRDFGIGMRSRSTRASTPQWCKKYITILTSTTTTTTTSERRVESVLTQAKRVAKSCNVMEMVYTYQNLSARIQNLYKPSQRKHAIIFWWWTIQFHVYLWFCMCVSICLYCGIVNVVFWLTLRRSICG